MVQEDQMVSQERGEPVLIGTDLPSLDFASMNSRVVGPQPRRTWRT